MKKLALIDGYNLLFRSYYATAGVGNLMQNSQGVYTNAIYGFVMGIQAILKMDFSHVLVALDAKGETFRHQQYPEYKGTRKPTPSELIMQFSLMREYLDAANIKFYETDHYEADDIIGYFAHHAKPEFDQIIIFSNDRDLMQLIDDNVVQMVSKRGFSDATVYDSKQLYETMGIKPSQMTDYKGLVGDPSDNIPGVPGIGDKTAVKLLQTYNDLESILEHTEELKGKLKENLITYADKARFSKQLATILIDFPNEFKVDELTLQNEDPEKLTAFYQKLEFHSFIRKLNLKSQDVKAAKAEAEYVIINDHPSRILTSPMGLHLELFGTNYHTAKKLGFGLYDGKNSFYVPFEVASGDKDFRDWLKDPLKEKYVFDLKALKASLLWEDIESDGFVFDLLLSAYLVNPNLTQDDFRAIASAFAYNDVAYDEEIYGKGAKYGLPEKPIYQRQAVKKAQAIYKLKDPILEKIKFQDQEELLVEVEIPLAKILAEMEWTGIKIDIIKLKSIGEDLNKRISLLEKEIRTQAGESDLNINSTRQLGTILFEKLNLPYYKKTKTGYSTDISVLKQLEGFHPIVQYIIDYRTLTKLYGTYFEGLSSALSLKGDGRIHTIYKQAETQTGRLSSIEPNLQNIPIRTEEGRELRKVFVADEDCLLLSSDYSQIELRVLAEMADVKHLKDAFKNNEDVHTHTASLIFKKDNVTPDERRAAKAVNFGIIYGKTTWGLSEDLKIPPKQAEAFIRNYYENYPEIKVFMEQTIAQAKTEGFVKTMMNRRRYIPELNSNNFQTREFGKRMAMNAPIQGSAADILKIAMVKLAKAIKESGSKMKMLLQIHDEVVLQVPKSEVEKAKKMVVDTMQSAVETNVPMLVEAAFGEDLFEVKDNA
ncbi:MAG: DNA polymerase I [Candidatus Izemoplasmatales bacterium]|nr:DNA polymerase I [Candidatus Izemoplasmatales bacterium]